MVSSDRFMKVLCVSLIAVVVTHLCCGVFCSAESSTPAAKIAAVTAVKMVPPCPEHSGNPANPTGPNPANDRCSQGLVLDAPVTAAKNAVFCFCAVAPAVVALTAAIENPAHTHHAELSPDAPFPLFRPILRI
jgi:hypothetical protein